MTPEEECLSVLAMTQSVLTAEEKCLLIQMLRLSKAAATEDFVTAFQEVTGLSKAALVKARDGLVAKRLAYGVTAERRDKKTSPAADTGSSLASGRGRAPMVFLVTNHCRSLLHGQAGNDRSGVFSRLLQSPHHDKVAGLLLTWRRVEEEKPEGADDEPKLRGRRRDVEQPVTRMLLAVLLGLADEGGVVRDVGSSTLARMAGIKPDSLDYQLGKLAEEGFLRSYVPGGTGRWLFGQVPGVFFLSLSHPRFLAPTCELLVACHDTVYQLDGDHPFKAGSWGYRQAHRDDPFDVLQSYVLERESILEDVKAWCHGQDVAWERVREWHERPHEGRGFEEWWDGGWPAALMGKEGRRIRGALWVAFGLGQGFQERSGTFVRYMQSLMEQYASEVLSNDWTDMTKGAAGYWKGELLERIEAELFPSGMLASRKGHALSELARKALALLVYLQSVRLAYAIKSWLLQDWLTAELENLGAARIRFTVLPVKDLEMKGRPVSLAVSLIAIGVATSWHSRVVEIEYRPVKKEGWRVSEVPLDGGEGVAACWLPAPGIKDAHKNPRGKPADSLGSDEGSVRPDLSDE